MIPYVVFVHLSPGRRIVVTRRFEARSAELARGQAAQVADQYAHRSRVARYRVTWALCQRDTTSGHLLPLARGALEPASVKRRG